MSVMTKSVDIIVLGATGCTGKCTVKQLANLTKEKYWDVTWGIAGRSKDKLQNLVTELNKAGSAIKDLKIIEADVENEDSLKKVLQEAKIVINCTGPNVLLSPKIVKACIETRTHYVDISAEILHMLQLYRDYNKPAEDANVLVIPACGFASVPAETAMIYLGRQFKGTLHTVECYTQLLLPTMLPGRAVLHNGTWTSLVYVMGTYREHLALKQEMFPKPIEVEPEEMKKSFFHRKNGHLWFPHPGVEDDVVEMSQRYLYERTQKKPVHYKTYTTISEGGPSDKMRQNTKYYFTLNAKGWELDADLKSEPTKTLSVKVSGQDPGYDSTAIAIIMCAITVLKEGSNMPKGGVIMPGAAFHKTDIVDRLMHDGYTFEVLDK